MARSPDYKVYDNEGKYQGCAKDCVLCAAMLCALPEGSTIRLSHGPIIYKSGVDGDPAESFDATAEIAYRREREYVDKIYDRQHGPGAAAKMREEWARKQKEITG